MTTTITVNGITLIRVIREDAGNIIRQQGKHGIVWARSKPHGDMLPGVYRGVYNAGTGLFDETLIPELSVSDFEHAMSVLTGSDWKA